MNLREKEDKIMQLPQIINSLLENVMYKFSMGQCIYHQFSAYKTTWTFKCRNTDVFFTSEMVEEIKAQIRAYCDLRFTEEELAYLENVKWIKGSYVDFLRCGSPDTRILRRHGGGLRSDHRDQGILAEYFYV